MRWGALIWSIVMAASFLTVQALGQADLVFEKPTLILGGDGSEPFFRVEDVTIDTDGHIYLIERDQSKILKFDMNGVLLTTFGGVGQGPGQFSKAGGLIFVGGKLWVADIFSQSVTFFENDRYLKRVSLDNVGSIAHVGNRVVVAPNTITGNFNVFDEKGVQIGKFKLDSGFVDVPYPKAKSLWETIRIITYNENEFVVGFLFLTDLARANLKGELTYVWNASDYYFLHPMNSRSRGPVPAAQSASTFAIGPDGMLWVTACPKNNKDCNILYQFDMGKNEAVKRIELKGHISQLRFSPDKKTLILLRREDRSASFYKL